VVRGDIEIAYSSQTVTTMFVVLVKCVLDLRSKRFVSTHRFNMLPRYIYGSMENLYYMPKIKPYSTGKGPKCFESIFVTQTHMSGTNQRDSAICLKWFVNIIWSGSEEYLIAIALGTNFFSFFIGLVSYHNASSGGAMDAIPSEVILKSINLIP